MFSRMSKTWDRKVHCIRKNVFWKIDDKKASRSESGPLFRPLPEASDDEEKVEDVNLYDIWKYILELRKPREQRNHIKAGSLRAFPWPNVTGLLDLKGIILLRSDRLITDIHEDVKAILGRVNVATVAPLVVAHTLERLDPSIINTEELWHNHTLERDASITNREELWHLAEVMYDLAIVLKRLSQSPKRTQDVMQEATTLIVEGARVFSLQRGPRKGGPPRSAADVNAIVQKLHTMCMHINITQFTVRDFTPMQHQRNPTHAESDPFSQPLPEASHDEAPFSGSLNVSMKSKRKNVDVSLCDEASSDLPKTSEDVDVNLNISGAPPCDEAPSSSSSSSGPTKSKSDLISNICKDIDKVEDFNLDDLMKHMSKLLKLREKGNHQEASILGHFPWPDFPGLEKLEEIVSFRTDLWIKDIHGLVKALLKQVGRVNVSTAAPLVVAHTLERLDASITNRKKC